jgi:hypothetical protein
MSLIAKIQQQSFLQNKLLPQIAEMSYQDVNGTRQAPRNFREGTLEIGKMNFTTPQDRITKEMIMDYQKSEQEKRSNQVNSAGITLLYEPTGLSDVIDVYNPIPYAPLGKAATEDDVRNYEAGLLQLHYFAGFSAGVLYRGRLDTLVLVLVIRGKTVVLTKLNYLRMTTKLNYLTHCGRPELNYLEKGIQKNSYASSTGLCTTFWSLFIQILGLTSQ